MSGKVAKLADGTKLFRMVQMPVDGVELRASTTVGILPRLGPSKGGSSILYGDGSDMRRRGRGTERTGGTDYWWGYSQVSEVFCKEKGK